MKILFYILLLVLIGKPASSQTPYMDSLRMQLVSNSKQDTQRVLLLSNFAGRMLYLKPDSAILYAQEGLNLARKIGFTKGEMLCKNDIGAIMWIVGEYSKANELLLQTLKFAESINDRYWQGAIYRDLSANNRDQGNYEEGLKYSYRAITLAKSGKQFGDELGLCYLETGAIYQEMNKLDSALYYLQRVNLSDNARTGYTGFKYLMMGLAYAKKGNDTLALKYYSDCINTLTGTNNYKDVATAYNSIAKIYDKEGKADSGIYYAKKGFNVAQNGSFKKGVFETSLFLSKIYEKRNASVSLNYFKIATAAKDSMFNLQKTTQFLNSQFNEQMQQQEEEANKVSYRNKIRIYTLLAAVGFFLLLAIILYRNNRQKQKSKAEIEKAYDHLKATQAQLVQSEKMASLGELTAGIAHEIQNPLNFVNNFSEVNSELLAEMNQEIDKGNYLEVKTIAGEINDNEKKISHHGKRADAIVKNMLQHSRTSKGVKEPTDINALCEEYLRLSYHGFRAKDKTFNATLKTDFDSTLEKINIVPQDIGRVLLNLYNNAFYAVSSHPLKGSNYKPLVSVTTKRIKLPASDAAKNTPLGDGGIEIIVTDNGNGILQNIIDKIFQPFFTTKPTGQGTGLGLSLSYDIIKVHGGEIKVETKEGEGAEFIIQLPIV